MSLFRLSFFYHYLQMALKRLQNLFKLSFRPLQLPQSPGPSQHQAAQVVLADESAIHSQTNITLPAWPHPCPLPSTEAVRARPKVLLAQWDEYVIHFEDLGLVVKYGKRVYLSEAHSMWMVSKLSSLRTPTLYGWYQDGGETFIFMEFVKGETLENRWPSLDEQDKLVVVSQLHEMVDSMRMIRPDPRSPPYLGSLRRDKIHDVVFDDRGVFAGPFNGLDEFTQGICSIGSNLRGYPDSDIFRNLRDIIPNEATAIVFTHADLHPTNIIIQGTGDAMVVTIIDWAQAGWRPEWWELLKARWAVRRADEWSRRYIHLFLPDKYEKPLRAFWELADTGAMI